MKNLQDIIIEKLKINKNSKNINSFCKTLDSLSEKYNLKFIRSINRNDNYSWIYKISDELNTNIYNKFDYDDRKKYQQLQKDINEFCRNTLHFSTESSISADMTSSENTSNVYITNFKRSLSQFEIYHKDNELTFSVYIKDNDFEQFQEFIIQIFDFIVQYGENK